MTFLRDSAAILTGAGRSDILYCQCCTIGRGRRSLARYGRHNFMPSSSHILWYPTFAHKPSQIMATLCVEDSVSGNGNSQNIWPKPLSPLSGDVAKEIELQRALKAEAAMASEAAFSPSDILYQDDWLVAINKPSGIYAGHVLQTVTSMLIPDKQVADEGEKDSTGSIASQPHLHLANRLDRDTSGIIIVTKCKIVAGKLTHLFQKRKAKKSYVALCIGSRPSWNEIHVETGHGRSRWGAWRVYANEDIGRKLPEKAVVKDMCTQFRVLSVNGEKIHQSGSDEKICEKRTAERDQAYENVPPSGDEIIIRAYPLTGRTHQIRLHCQFLGLPLLGDVKYGGPLIWKGVTYEAHALHAETMSFRHPITNVELSLSAPLPKWAVV